jgi:LacI family transcriptional regulator
MSATIKDVARLAQCSIKTVSRVINNEAHVTEKTRTRVQAAIRSSGYVPNLSARRLVQQKSYAICILIYPGFIQPASTLLTRLLDLTYEENYDLLLQTYYPSFPKSRRKLADLVSGRRFDGFISTPPCEADGFVANLLETYKIPLVQVNPLDWELSQIKNPLLVTSEDISGARLAVEHLIALGHSRISCLHGPRNFRATFDRLSGYQDAMAASGLEVNPGYIQDSEFTFDGGYTAAQILMHLPEPPTAIYAANDEAALGVLFAAHELCLDVPGQLSICGHEDILAASRTWPGLTTVHQPVEDLLEKAARLLIDVLKGNELSNLPVIIPPRLIIRGSTGRISEKKPSLG